MTQQNDTQNDGNSRVPLLQGEIDGVSLRYDQTASDSEPYQSPMYASTSGYFLLKDY